LAEYGAEARTWKEAPDLMIAFVGGKASSEQAELDGQLLGTQALASVRKRTTPGPEPDLRERRL